MFIMCASFACLVCGCVCAVSMCLCLYVCVCAGIALMCVRVCACLGYLAVGNDRGRVLLYRLNHYTTA